MPPALRVLVALAKYAGVRRHPDGDPERARGRADPDRADPAPPGHRLQPTSSALAHEVGYVFYLDPGPGPGMSKAYWGPEIRLGAPQPPLDAALDGPHNNVKSLRFRFDKEKKELPVDLHPGAGQQGRRSPSRSRTSPRSTRRSGSCRRCRRKITSSRTRRSRTRWPRRCAGSPTRASTPTRCSDRGRWTSTRYGAVLKSRQLVGVRGAGEAFDGLHYVTSVTSRLKRG